jgi:hypothetical protein
MEALIAVGAFGVLFTAFVVLPKRLLRREEED